MIVKLIKKMTKFQDGTWIQVKLFSVTFIFSKVFAFLSIYKYNNITIKTQNNPKRRKKTLGKSHKVHLQLSGKSRAV